MTAPRGVPGRTLLSGARARVSEGRHAPHGRHGVGQRLRDAIIGHQRHAHGRGGAVKVRQAQDVVVAETALHVRQVPGRRRRYPFAGDRVAAAGGHPAGVKGAASQEPRGQRPPARGGHRQTRLRPDGEGNRRGRARIGQEAGRARYRGVARVQQDVGRGDGPRRPAVGKVPGGIGRTHGSERRSGRRQRHRRRGCRQGGSRRGPGRAGQRQPQDSNRGRGLAGAAPHQEGQDAGGHHHDHQPHGEVEEGALVVLCWTRRSGRHQHSL